MANSTFEGGDTVHFHIDVNADEDIHEYMFEIKDAKSDSVFFSEGPVHSHVKTMTYEKDWVNTLMGHTDVIAIFTVTTHDMKIIRDSVAFHCHPGGGHHHGEGGKITLYFDTKVGSQDFALNTDYTTAMGEDFKVTLLQYYVSNIKLKKKDGSSHLVPTTETSGYYLVKAGERERFTFDVPNGEYTGVEFIVGVDSLRSTMGPEKRLGHLDVGNDTLGKSMYWSWNSGYIFLKYEGHSTFVPDSVRNKSDTTQWNFTNDVFQVHVGGFGGYSTATPNNNRTVDLSVTGAGAKVSDEHAASFHLYVDVKKIMDGPTADKNLSFTEYFNNHSPTFTGPVANNYQHMFVIDHVH